MLVLCGKTCSGKTTVADILVRDYGYEKCVTYTTRPKRPGEVDGKDYHFVTEEEFDKMLPLFAETAEYHASFGYCRYGSLKNDYTEGKKVIVLNPYGIESIREQGLKPLVIELEVDTPVLKKRLMERGDDLREINRRLFSDNSDFKKFHYETLGPDVILTVKDEETAEKTAEKVNDIFKKVNVA